MILLSHEQQCSLAPTNDRHGADCLHPLRRSEPNRDLAYLIRTLLRFSRNENAAKLADPIGDSESREGRICSARSDSSSRGLPSSDRLHTCPGYGTRRSRNVTL